MIYTAVRKYPHILPALLLAAVATFLQLEVSATTSTLHFALNTESSQSQAIANGFNMMDVTGSTSNPSTTASLVNALPSGVRAMIWVGNMGNIRNGSCLPSYTDAQYQALVNALASNPKVYGYYLSDEPHPSQCPTAAADIAARADYLHQAAPSQKAFIVVLDGSNYCAQYGCEYAALKPSITHIDYMGLDPYPCHFDGSGNPVPCNLTLISDRYNAAIANGVPQSAIVPVYQTFGQEGRTDGGSVYYRTPSASELQSMLDKWASLNPSPAFDYSYTWGSQCSPTSCVSPQALTNHSELQTVMNSHNIATASISTTGSGAGGTPSSPSGTGSTISSNPTSPTSGNGAPPKINATTTPDIGQPQHAQSSNIPSMSFSNALKSGSPSAIIKSLHQRNVFIILDIVSAVLIILGVLYKAGNLKILQRAGHFWLMRIRP